MIRWRELGPYPDRVEELRQMDPFELHDFLVGEKRAQAESFGKYLLKQGKTDDVSREWPIQPAPDGWAPDQLPAERRDGAA